MFFDVAIAEVEKKLNKIMFALIKKAELKQNDVGKYKVEHTIQSDEVYSLMVPDCKQYPEIMKLLSSTTSVKCGFSALNLIHTKQRNQLTVKSIDRLMFIVLVGPEKLTKSQ